MLISADLFEEAMLSSIDQCRYLNSILILIFLIYLFLFLTTNQTVVTCLLCPQKYHRGCLTSCKKC
jgi:hypothetical protein